MKNKTYITLFQNSFEKLLGCTLRFLRLNSHLFCHEFMFYFCYVYLLTYTGVQHDFHITCYYMTSDNVFSDWLTSLVTFFDKRLCSTRKKSRELNITFQRSSRHLKIEMVFPNYLKSSSQSSSGEVLSSNN
jgi:hypothetical protein